MDEEWADAVFEIGASSGAQWRVPLAFRRKLVLWLECGSGWRLTVVIARLLGLAFGVSFFGSIQFGVVG